MAKQVLDLYELFNLVVERGGLVDVINKKLWQEIIKGLKLPSSITSAAFTLRTQYMKYLYAFECEKKGFSSSGDLQTAIDGNRRESRRSSYGAYGEMVPPQLLLSGIPGLGNPLQGLMGPRPPQMNGNGLPSPFHPDLLGRTGSPPSPDSLMQDATRFAVWNMYKHNMGSGGGIPGMLGPNEEDIQRLAAAAASQRQLAVGQPVAPPQKEALNLAEVKEEVPFTDHWSSLQQYQRTNVRSRDNSDLRLGKGDENGQPSKRLHQASSGNSPPTKIPSSNGFQMNASAISIKCQGGDRSQEQSIKISMELNGMNYHGILYPNLPSAAQS